MNKRHFAYIFTICIILNLIVYVPYSFAETYSFSEQPISNTDYTYIYSNTNDTYLIPNNITNGEYYAFIGYINGLYNVYICSKNNFENSIFTLKVGNNSTSSSTPSYSSSYDIYYTSIQRRVNYSEYFRLPVFTSLNEAFESVNEYINHGTTYESFHRIITIQPGYVAYIETNGGTLDLRAQFSVKSNIVRPFWRDGVRIKFGGEYTPESGMIFDSSFGNSIDWLKSAQGQNFLGFTNYGGKQFEAGLPNDGSCVVIYNPAFMPIDNSVGSDSGTIGPVLTAEFSNVVSVQKYPLRDNMIIDGINSGFKSDSTDDYNTSYVYIPNTSESSIKVSDNDYVIVDRANNTTSPAITIPALPDNSVDSGNFLENAVRSIQNLLSAPIEHIQNLYNAGVSFFQYLSSFWSWIPVEITSIIVSAVIVLIVIGVIKVLWK